MEANQARAPRQRIIRPCTRCNIGHYGPKDAQCQRVIQNQPNGDGPEAILANVDLQPVRIVGRVRRRQPRRRRADSPNNGDIHLDDEHIDPNASDSEAEDPGDDANRVWDVHNTREIPLLRGMPDMLAINSQQNHRILVIHAALEIFQKELVALRKSLVCSLPIPL